MVETLRKSWGILSLLLLLVLLASLVFRPALARPLGTAILVVSLGVTVFFTVQQNWQACHQAGEESGQFIRHVALDLLGLGLALGTAMYAGQLAGTYVGLCVGLWAGLAAGFAASFLAAWGMRIAWERLAAKV
jgi:hypothetical protein